MRRILVVAVLVLAVGAVVYWRTHPRLSDQEQIVQTILQVQRAVETKNAGQLLSCVADDYDDGAFKKRDITQMVIMGFRSPEPLRVQAEQPTISIQGDRATVEVKARFWFGQPNSPGEKETALQVRAELMRARGGWKVIRASGWEPAAGMND